MVDCWIVGLVGLRAGGLLDWWLRVWVVGAWWWWVVGDEWWEVLVCRGWGWVGGLVDCWVCGLVDFWVGTLVVVLVLVVVGGVCLAE